MVLAFFSEKRHLYSKNFSKVSPSLFNNLLYTLSKVDGKIKKDSKYLVER